MFLALCVLQALQSLYLLHGSRTSDLHRDTDRLDGIRVGRSTGLVSFRLLTNSSGNHQGQIGLKDFGHQGKVSKENVVKMSADDFRQTSNLMTGNRLIDDYGKNDIARAGENGRGLNFAGAEKKLVDSHMKKYQVNVLASDIIPLNRMVPDSRPLG